MSPSEGRSWTLEFGDIPIGPNDHVNRWERARQNRRWRVAAWALATAQAIPPCPRIRVSLLFTRRALGVSDTDNDIARSKPAIDGIVDAHVIATDTPRYIEWGPVTETRGRRGFTLTIEELTS